MRQCKSCKSKIHNSYMLRLLLEYRSDDLKKEVIVSVQHSGCMG